MPIFSIVVPIYKVEPYLDECVKSILSQTYTDFELILVDDGSPDRCPEICDNYRELDRRVKVIHKPNGGVTSARNAGVQNAIGDYLVFVDGDDFIGEMLLANLYAIIFENPVDVVAFGYTDYSDNACGEKHYNNLAAGKYIGNQLEGIYDKLLIDRTGNTLNCGAIYHYLCTKSVKREFFWNAQRLIPQEIIKGEDAAVVMMLVNQCSQLYVSDLCDYYYRYVPSSASHAFKEDMLRSHRILYDFLGKNCNRIPNININKYMIISLEFEIIHAAGVYQSYNLFMQFIRDHVLGKFDDVIYAPLKLNLPPHEYLKFFVLRKRWFILYWLYYHHKKL